MSSSLLVSPVRTVGDRHTGEGHGAPPRAASWWQRCLRRRVHARLANLRSGALELADGVGTVVLGDPSGEFGRLRLRVRDPAFYDTLARAGAVGAGEAFVEGLWHADDLVAVLRVLVRDRDVLLDVDRSTWSLPRRLALRLAYRLRRNSRTGSRQNIADHYDLSDGLFRRFLDPTMTYSSAWFAEPGQSLEAAQREKLRRLCELVDLGAGDRLLEIGTGWGSLALTAVEDFGAEVTTTTISDNQFAEASRRVAEAGLRDRVTLLRRDYRDLEGTFDKLISCEMIEAVGADYLPGYLRACAARLRPGGILGLQAITIRDQHYRSALRNVDYIKRHVFPGSFIPSIGAITRTASAHTDLQLVHMQDFGLHYAETLRRWRQTWEDAGPPVIAGGGGERLLRAWSFYFAYCEAGFRERHIGVCHMRFERPGVRR